MQVTIKNQSSDKIHSENRQFSYGADGCNTCFLVFFCPFYMGSVPTQAYNTIVFNNQKQRIQKYYNGFGIWVCCSPKLETIINYNQITSMTREKYIYRWSRGVSEINVIIVCCRTRKIKLFIPENACYVSENHFCCYQPFSVNGLDCCRDRYEKLSIEILDYWQSILGSVTQLQLNNQMS